MQRYTQKKAIELGDAWGNANNVLNAIEAKRRQQEEAEKCREEAEKRRKEEEKYREEEIIRKRKAEQDRKIYVDAMRRALSDDISEIETAIRDLQTISRYKDSAQQIQRFKVKISSIEREREQKRLKQKRAIETACKVVLVLATVVAVFFVRSLLQ